jgi:hypothetical protein
MRDWGDQDVAGDIAEMEKRPGLVTFAAIMMIIMGSFQVLVAASEMVRAYRGYSSESDLKNLLEKMDLEIQILADRQKELKREV